MGFPGVFKKNSCGVSMVSMVFDYGSSKGCHTILQNFQGFKLVFSGISKDKVTNLKFRQWFSKIVRGLTKKLHAFPQLEILHLWCYLMLTGRKPCVYGYVLNFLAIYITGFFMRFQLQGGYANVQICKRSNFFHQVGQEKLFIYPHPADPTLEVPTLKQIFFWSQVLLITHQMHV